MHFVEYLNAQRWSDPHDYADTEELVTARIFVALPPGRDRPVGQKPWKPYRLPLDGQEEVRSCCCATHAAITIGSHLVALCRRVRLLYLLLTQNAVDRGCVWQTRVTNTGAQSTSPPFSTCTFCQTMCVRASIYCAYFRLQTVALVFSNAAVVIQVTGVLHASTVNAQSYALTVVDFVMTTTLLD